jgi:L-seryl-tRNA(Ser) seleniumtransferase
MVGYSGGKCLRGPQCAGLLLGRKDLVRAAWVHSSPHHGLGRSMKVGKEEVIGMLMAVEMWMKRDHQAEWARWLSWMEQIARRVTALEAVTATVRREVAGLSNRTPGLRIGWDPTRMGITGSELARLLFTTEPRIVVEDASRRPGESGIEINAYMMQPGEARVVANRIHAVLSDPARARAKAPAPPPPPAAELSGQWDVEIEYIGSRSRHSFSLRQDGAKLTGKHQGDFVSRELSGTLEGKAVHLHSAYRSGGNELRYDFSGTVEGDSMSGPLDLGEYLTARWSARRSSRREGGPPQPRP